MRIVFTLILTLSLVLDVFATTQVSDIIIYQGKKYGLHSNPMEPYFEKNPNKRPQDGIVTTALWRGYVATFEIIVNQLFLKDIEILYKDTTSKKASNTKWVSVLHQIFPSPQALKIDWLSELIVLPQGEPLNNDEIVHGSTYTEYILLEIDKGYLKKEIKYSHKEYEEFKERQFQAFKKTDEYKKVKADFKKIERSDENIDSLLRHYIIEYTSKILIQ